jgi:hypothetical protein
MQLDKLEIEFKFKQTKAAKAASFQPNKAPVLKDAR